MLDSLNQIQLVTTSLLKDKQFCFKCCKYFIYLLEIRCQENLAKLLGVSSENKGKQPKGKNMNK